MSKCSRCKSSKVEWSYLVEVQGKEGHAEAAEWHEQVFVREDHSSR